MSTNDQERGATRRRLLGTLGAGVTATLAGCADLAGDETDVDPTFSHPETVRIDEPFGLEIDGLPDGAEVDVTATAEDDTGSVWSATATYEATDGTIDLATDEPIAGPFDSDEPITEPSDDAAGMRLLQLMEPETDSEVPYSPPAEEQLSIEVTGEDVSESTTITRQFEDPEVTETTDIDHDSIVGTLFEPEPTAATGAAVVALHGSEGRQWTTMAQLLAGNGIVALALQYFGAGDLPPELVSVPIELVDEAATWLRDHEQVDRSSVGAIGISKGAELALLAGSQFDSIGSVVSINGSGVVWEGVSETDTSPGSSWTLDGDPIPYVPYTDDPDVWDTTPPLELEPAYTASYADAPDDRIEDATIPVEEIDGPVVLVSGGDDRLWDAVDLSSIAMDRLEAADREDAEHLIFEDAGHAIQYPYVPTANRERGGQFVMGGTPEGYAQADAGYWPRAIEVLGA